MRYALRGVDPDLFYIRVIEEGLEYSETGDGVINVPAGVVALRQRWDGTQERPFTVVVDGCINQRPHLGALPERIEAFAADEFTDFILNECQCIQSNHFRPFAAFAYPVFFYPVVQEPRPGLRGAPVAKINLWITLLRKVFDTGSGPCENRTLGWE